MRGNSTSSVIWCELQIRSIRLIRLDRHRRGRRRSSAWLPGDADIAVDECLAGHAIAFLELLIGQVLALLRFDRVGILQPLLDLAFAGAADAAAAFEGNSALLAQR